MNLSQWLDHIAAVHPQNIELGLGRIHQVALRLGLGQPAATVFTVAGTNGKGSTAVAIEAILLASGLRTGCYLSPHIERFNERIRINGVDCDDAAICAALARVERARIEQARGEISLSYFEFATLAALSLFNDANLGAGLDAAILEVGLGGRLDAVNIIDADVAVITNIALDHEAWLGSTREAIGAEKAGILRPAAPLVYGEAELPESIARHARELAAPLYLSGRDFGIEREHGAWCWWGTKAGKRDRLDGLELPKLLPETSTAKVAAIHGLELPRLLPDSLTSMATAIQAVRCSPLPVSGAAIRAIQPHGGLPGRLEMRRDAGSGLPVLLDVAHNPAAAGRLAAGIAELRGSLGGKVAVVLAMLADKRIEGFAAALGPLVDVWYIAGIDEPRAMTPQEQARRLRQCLPDADIAMLESVPEAWRAATRSEAKLVVVTGSFHTVAAVRHLTAAATRADA